MNRKKVILLALILLLVLASGAVAVVAEGEALSVSWNSGLGGGSGGGVSNSAGFHLTGSTMGAISNPSNSASFKLCAGFLCLEARAVYLPIVVK